MRIVKRVLLGLLALVVFGVLGGLVFIHTPSGRAFLRSQVESNLSDTFTGGATVGGLEGSPFGDLVLTDVVINGPDGKPAITVGRLTIELGLLPLMSHQARIGGLTAEDVVVDLRRDQAGDLQIANLLKPGPKSKWSVHIPDLVIARARVAFDTGTEVMHVDDIAMTGAIKMPYNAPLDLSASIRGTWRERNVPIAIETAVHVDDEQTIIPALVARAGDVAVAGTNVRIVNAGPTFGGALVVHAPRAAVAKLVPELDLPGDAIVAITASPRDTLTHAEIDGQMLGDAVHAVVDADLVRKHASGLLSTSNLDVAKWTRGKVAARGSAFVSFDVDPPVGEEMPKGSVVAYVSGTYQDLPDSTVTIAARSDGTAVNAQVGATNRGFTASIEAVAKRLGKRITLERGTVVATTRDPAAASGGKAPVHGALRANLSATGVLAPRVDLAVVGRVDGDHVSAAGVRIDTLQLALDARRLPDKPIGRAELHAKGVTSGDMFLRDLDLTAANRADNKIAVTLRTRPKQDPWLIEADALVTTGDVVTIDLERHRVRAGTGTDWTGDSGHIAISKRRIELRDFKSASKDGTLALEGMFQRASGDLSAKLDVGNFNISTLAQAYQGTLEAHATIERRAGKLSGDVEAHGKGLVVNTKVGQVSADAKIHAAAGALTVDLQANGGQLGSAKVEVDVDAPANIADAHAWKKLTRSAIRTGRVSIAKIDIANLAKVAGVEGDYRGRLDGDIRVSALTTGGTVVLRDLMGPALREAGPVSADLHISQSAPDELTPSLTARVDGIGGIEASAKLRIPERLFDPAAWHALGRGAFEGAWVRAENIAIDPAQLDRLGITTWARGTASLVAEVGNAAADAKLSLALRTLRGSPISQPVDADLLATIDAKGSTANLKVRTREHRMQNKQEVPVGPSVALLDVDGSIPLTMQQLVANPRAALGEKLSVTAKIPDAPAKHVLAVFGRTEVTGGTIAGTVEIAGTVGKPTAQVHLAAANIAVPPGAGGKPIKTMRKLAVDATWDGTTGKATIDGTQDSNGTLHVDAAGSPDALAEATVALTAKQFDLQPVLVFAPGPAGGSAGRLDANLKVVGLDPKTARLAGEIHLNDGRVPIAPEVGTLRRAKIDVTIGEKSMKVAVDGRIGRGGVALRGTIAMAGALPTGGEATLALRKTSPIGVVEPSIDADASVKLRREPDKWVLDIVVKHGDITVPDARGNALHKPGAPSDMIFVTGDPATYHTAKENLPPPAPEIVANITILPTHIKSAELNGIVRGKLTITADADMIGIVGAIDTDRGDLDLFGKRYQVERARVVFDGNIDPLLDVLITHDFKEVTTTTQVRGRLSKPQLVMSSNPGTYSQAQLLGFLLGGEPNGDPQGDARDRATSAGASYVANQIGGYVKKALPVDVDVLRYEAATSSTSAAITVGTWVTKSIFLAYRQHLEARPDENLGEGQVEYWFTRRTRVEATAGDRNVDGIDLVWRKRY